MQTALVTGANRGIGFELTRQLSDSGYHVIATCRSPERAESLRKLESAAVEILPLDVTCDDSVANLLKTIGRRPIDVLVNNAGTVGTPLQTVTAMDYEAWLNVFAVNTLAPFRLTVALKANLLESDRPRVITLSSQMGSLHRRSVGAYAYRSSKAAVNKVMQVLAVELEGDGIIVCPVHPGWVRTEMGGQGADIDVTESAAGLVRIINTLTHEHSGRFWTWDGKEHPW